MVEAAILRSHRGTLKTLDSGPELHNLIASKNARSERPPGTCAPESRVAVGDPFAHPLLYVIPWPFFFSTSGLAPAS